MCYLEDLRGRLTGVPIYDDHMKKINYFKKRNFIVKAENLPKQFGFEVEVKNLHYDERLPILAKHLVQGRSCISKLFFVFNLNNVLLDDNQNYHKNSQQFGYQGHLDSQIESSFSMPDPEFG